jgi:hypothetical protein
VVALGHEDTIIRQSITIREADALNQWTGSLVSPSRRGLRRLERRIERVTGGPLAPRLCISQN